MVVLTWKAKLQTPSCRNIVGLTYAVQAESLKCQQVLAVQCNDDQNTANRHAAFHVLGS